MNVSDGSSTDLNNSSDHLIYKYESFTSVSINLEKV